MQADPGSIVDIKGVAFVVGADGKLYKNDAPPAGQGEFDFTMRDPTARSTRPPNPFPGIKAAAKRGIIGEEYDPAVAAHNDAIKRRMTEWGKFINTPVDMDSYEDVIGFVADWLQSRDFTTPIPQLTKMLTAVRDARKDKFIGELHR